MEFYCIFNLNFSDKKLLYLFKLILIFFIFSLLVKFSWIIIFFLCRILWNEIDYIYIFLIIRKNLYIVFYENENKNNM